MNTSIEDDIFKKETRGRKVGRRFLNTTIGFNQRQKEWLDEEASRWDLTTAEYVRKQLFPDGKIPPHTSFETIRKRLNQDAE
jgi:hypothetical protein